MSLVVACGSSKKASDNATAAQSITGTPTAAATQSISGTPTAAATLSISGTPTEARQTAAPTAPPTTAPTAQDTPSTSALSLEVKEFKITAKGGGAITSVPAGKVAVEVHSIGTVLHEVVFIKTDSDPGSLPLDGPKVDEDEAGTVIGKIADVARGATKGASFDLAPGKYALICNIPAHYQQGMYAQLIVQ